MIYSVLLIPALATVVSAATNDWSVPCTTGECSYDLKSTNTGAVDGNIRIWGNANAIADITTAAGWEIIGCDSDALVQDIRLVCVDPTDGACDNLYRETGATGKVVRLPESCGAGPFAVVNRAWVPKDQSLPAALRKRLVRRQGEPAVVQALALSTDFAAVDPAVNGDVNMELTGSTIPGNAGGADIVPPVRRSNSRIYGRGFSSFFKNAIKKLNSFDKELKKTLPPIQRTETRNLADLNIDCPASDIQPLALTLKASADISGTIDMIVDIGLVASGRIIPPKIEEFALFAGMTGSFAGTLDLTANARGQVDSGLITLFQAGVPGLSFPGIISIGPTFKLDAQATAVLDADVAVTVALNYKVDDAKLFFPSSDDRDAESGGKFAPIDSALKVSVSPSVATAGRLEAHIIPSIEFGINAIAGFVEASVFLSLDAVAAAELTFNAGATITAGEKDLAKFVNGCVAVSAGLGVNAGATADFFGLFNPETKVNLFKADFSLFKKCFGDVPAPTRREIMYQMFRRASEARAVSLPRGLVEKRVLTCTGAGSFAGLFSLVDEVIGAQAITPA